MSRKKSYNGTSSNEQVVRDGENKTVKIVIAGLFWRSKRNGNSISKTTPRYNRTFPDLNSYIYTASGKNSGANARWMLKKKYQGIACTFIRRQTSEKLMGNLFFHYDFYETDKKRDPSNIASIFIKIFEDALQECEVIPNDSWNIQGYTCHFHVDKENPRVEVTIQEI